MTIGNLITTHSNTRSSSSLALWLAAVVLTLTGVAHPHAQQPAGDARTFISINGGLQALTGSFSESVGFPESGGVYREVLSAAAAQEQARFESDYRYRAGSLFDVSGGYCQIKIVDAMDGFSHILASSSPKHVACSPLLGCPLNITPFGEISGAPHSNTRRVFGSQPDGQFRPTGKTHKYVR